MGDSPEAPGWRLVSTTVAWLVTTFWSGHFELAVASSSADMGIPCSSCQPGNRVQRGCLGLVSGTQRRGNSEVWPTKGHWLQPETWISALGSPSMCMCVWGAMRWDQLPSLYHRSCDRTLLIQPLIQWLAGPLRAQGHGTVWHQGWAGDPGGRLPAAPGLWPASLPVSASSMCLVRPSVTAAQAGGH